MGDGQGLPHMRSLLPLLLPRPGGVRSPLIAQTLTIINTAGLPKWSPAVNVGGEGGIRTLGSVNYTRIPIVHLRPLGHLSLFELAEREGFEPSVA